MLTGAGQLNYLVRPRSGSLVSVIAITPVCSVGPRMGESEGAWQDADPRMEGSRCPGSKRATEQERFPGRSGPTRNAGAGKTGATCRSNQSLEQTGAPHRLPEGHCP